MSSITDIVAPLLNDSDRRITDQDLTLERNRGNRILTGYSVFAPFQSPSPAGG